MFILNESGKKLIRKKVSTESENDIDYAYMQLAQKNMNQKQKFEVYIFEIHSKNGKAINLKLKPKHYTFYRNEVVYVR